MSTKIRIKKERTVLIIKKTSFFSKRYRLFFSKKKIYSKKGRFCFANLILISNFAVRNNFEGTILNVHIK